MNVGKLMATQLIQGLTPFLCSSTRCLSSPSFIKPRLQCARRKPLWRAMRHYTPRTFSVTSSSLCWLFLFLPLLLISNIPPSTSVSTSCPFSIPACLPASQNEKICRLVSSVILSPLQCPPPTPLPVSACLITWSAEPI